MENDNTYVSTLISLNNYLIPLQILLLELFCVKNHMGKNMPLLEHIMHNIFVLGLMRHVCCRLCHWQMPRPAPFRCVRQEWTNPGLTCEMKSVLSELKRSRLRVPYSKPGSLELWALRVSKISPSRSISSGSAKRERSSSSCMSLVPEHCSGLSVTLQRETCFKETH